MGVTWQVWLIGGIVIASGLLVFLWAFIRGFIREARSDPQRHEVWAMIKGLLRPR